MFAETNLDQSTEGPAAEPRRLAIGALQQRRIFIGQVGDVDIEGQVLRQSRALEGILKISVERIEIVDVSLVIERAHGACAEGALKTCAVRMIPGHLTEPVLADGRP